VSEYERIRDEVLAKIAQNGKCFTNEARSMAIELTELRAKQPKQADPVADWSPYSMVFPTIP
jgi:hypothetical protein